MAEGLAAAHSKGIVHRDVKPENVFLTRDGHAKLLDFGLARSLPVLAGGDETHSPTLDKMTSEGVVLGTVAYMSPEQARGQPVDHRSDQFSLGIVFYEMLRGRRPFQCTSAAEILTAIIREEPEALSQEGAPIPAPVCWLVGRCLAKERDERYDSTRDLARELSSLRAHLSEATFGSVEPVAPGASPRQHKATLRGALTLVAVAAATSAVWVAAGRTRSWPPGAPRLTFQRVTSQPGVETKPAL